METIEKLKEENQRLKELLRRVEWSGSKQTKYGYAGHCCPICRGFLRTGHISDCQLAQATGEPEVTETEAAMPVTHFTSAGMTFGSSVVSVLLLCLTACSGIRVRENEVVVGADGKERALPKRELLAVAFMSKQSIGKIKAEGLAEAEDILQDSTDVPKAITTAVMTYGLGKVAGDVAKASSADKARVDIGAQKASVATEGIKAKAAATSEALKAGAEVAPISINAP